jgi:hypothetical protein
LQARADALIPWEPPEQTKSAIGRLAAVARSLAGFPADAGRLIVELPAGFDPAWRRDGLEEKPPRGLGERAWWLTQILSLVPPAHWESRFGADPASIVAAAKTNEWASSLCTGWTRAALLFRTAPWAAPLLAWWYALEPDTAGRTLPDAYRDLVRLMPQAEAEGLAMDLLRLAGDSLTGVGVAVLDALPRPWSAQFGRLYLERLERHASRLRSSNPPTVPHHWQSTLATAALALPIECLDEAGRTGEVPDTGAMWARSWYVYWQREWNMFSETLQIRRQLTQEIPCD